MSLSHPSRVMIPKGKRRSKTVKKFTSSPRNKSPKTAKNTLSPIRHTIIRFYKVDPPHDPIIFNFTKLTNKNYNKLIKNYKEEMHALGRAHKQYGQKGYYYEHDRADAESEVLHKNAILKVISKEIRKVYAILKRKAQTKKTASKIKKGKKIKR